MVHLTREEESMLDGEHGPTIQEAMETLVKVGDAYGAERMIDVSYAHLIAWELTDAAFELTRKLTEDVKVKVPTTVNPVLINLDRLKELNLPESARAEAQKLVSRLTEIHRRIGVIPTYTCHPHFLYELRKGEHIALTESNVAMFANSWFGAMTNLEGATTAIASAITGKTPEYGLHFRENRYGKALIEIGPDLEPGKFTDADYSALAFWTGKVIFHRIPVYSGLAKNMTAGHAKYMCAPQINNSPAAMFHIVGVTPEAATLEAAFGGRKPEEKFAFGKKELEDTYRELCSAIQPEVGLVCLGCPHCTLQEIVEIARLLEGRKVSPNVRLLVGTSEPIRVLAKRMGAVDIIEGAGGLLLSDACSGAYAARWLAERLGIGVVASTSASLTSGIYRRSQGRLRAWFGSTEKCANAAVKGKWEDT